MASDGIRVTVTDLATGEEMSGEVHDDYRVILAGSAYVANVAVYPTTGTHVITVKGVGKAVTTDGQ